MYEFLRDSMFDVFSRRKKQREVCLHMRRILDATCPDVLPPDAEKRSHNRYNRNVPVVVIPAIDDELAVDDALFGVSKDLSDAGACLLMLQQLDVQKAVCGFWVENAVFMYGEVARSVPFGAGMWLLGLQFRATLGARDAEPLLSLADVLRPDVLPSGGIPRRGLNMGA